MDETGEKFCRDCGETIKKEAEICPKCGVRQKTQPSPASQRASVNGKNRATATILTFFLGGLGAHKFYLGQVGQGIVYLLFFWTLIPAFIACIEFFIFLTMGDEAFSRKYCQ